MEASELSESIENYLEAILFLEKTQRVARTKDIADRLGINRGSVTGALKTLSEKELINYAPYSFITLTAKGKRIAQEITRRHEILKDFLLNILHIDPEKADETACRMEHAIDKDTADRLLRFIEFINTCPRTGKDWIQLFTQYCVVNEGDKLDCESCIREISENK